jgi:magnesium transporter
VAVRPEWTVDEALAHVRLKGKDSETINVVYITDARWKLAGVLGLRRLILAKPTERVDDIMEESVISIPAFEDRERAVQLISRYDITVLPVVDANGILLGIVTVDDLIDVAEEEATEDFQKSAAVHPLKASYRESSMLSLYTKRVTWLASLLGISVVTTGILASQAETLNSAIALAFFIPLLIGTGGNTGNQSATLMIRALATGDIREGQWLGALLREVGIGLILGCFLGVMVVFWSHWLTGNWLVALAVGSSLVVISTMATFFGSLLPLIFVRLGIDPAVVSAPFISTMVDVLGVFTYFQIAKWILAW